jgi:hypothetical protein
VDHDWVVTFDVEDADLEQRSVRCWAYEHRQVVVQKYSSHRVAHGMPYVRIGDPVLSRWLADPHLDNIACLADDIGGFAPSVPWLRQAQRTVLSIDNCQRTHPRRSGIPACERDPATMLEALGSLPLATRTRSGRSPYIWRQRTV